MNSSAKQDRASPDQPSSTGSEAEPRHRVRLPGFLIDEEVGMGDLVKRVTYAFGVGACDACEKRAAALNRWMVFSR